MSTRGYNRRTDLRRAEDWAKLESCLQIRIPEIRRDDLKSLAM